jgi:putative protease
MPELLAPAGDLATARIAMRFGADAVYLGGSMLQLRAGSTGFSINDIKTIAHEAHLAGRRVYVTVNAYARDSELEALAGYAVRLRDAEADACIISDPGVMSIFHETAPELPIHVSTQANCMNSAAAMAYYALGARRVVPARELTLDQLAEMRRRLPRDMEIETFIHGAMCMAYSGRCMISAFLTGRSGNRGGCTQPCRWKYTIAEETRPGMYFPLEETEGGMALFSSRDLNAMAFLDRLVEIGVESFKIEGRMKSEYYCATVVNAYRMRLDAILEGRAADLPALERELDSVSHRPYSSGFYFNELVDVPGDGGEYERGCMYIANVDSVENGRARITLKNKFTQGELLEVLSPGHTGRAFTAANITDLEGERYTSASVPTKVYEIDVPSGVSPGDMLRRRM